MSSDMPLVNSKVDPIGCSRQRGPYAVARAHPCGLSGKEIEVLALIVQGANNLAIAAKLNRSRRTIEHHVSAILTKLGVSSRLEAALRATSNPKLLSTQNQRKIGEAEAKNR